MPTVFSMVVVLFVRNVLLDGCLGHKNAKKLHVKTDNTVTKDM
jgi:hypothetical protein